MSEHHPYSGIILQDKKVPLYVLEERAKVIRQILPEHVEVRAVENLDALNGDLNKYSLFFVHMHDGEARRLMGIRAMHPHIEVILWWSDAQQNFDVRELMPIRGPLAYQGPVRLQKDEWKRVIPEMAKMYLEQSHLEVYATLEELLAKMQPNTKLY